MTPAVPDHTILLVHGGSHAYGTATEDSDHDYVAVTIEPPERVFSLRTNPEAAQRTISTRSQPVGQPSSADDWDMAVHPLRRYLALAAKGNPNMLECLWAPEVQTWGRSNYGVQLRNRRGWFIGRHLITPYLGYMRSQMQRFMAPQVDPSPDSPRRKLIEEHGYDTKAAMHVARLGWQCLELLCDSTITMPSDYAGDLLDIRQGRMRLNDWQVLVVKLMDAIRHHETDGSIPEGPDLDRIRQWSIATHLGYWRSMR